MPVPKAKKAERKEAIKEEKAARGKRRKRRLSAKEKSGERRAPKGTRKLTLRDGTPRESVIQRDILDWLKTTGLLHWRANSGSLFLHGRHINLGPLGCADISVIVPPQGRFVGLEVKTAKGRIRPDQLTYSAGLTAQGGLYFIVRSVADAKRAIAQALGEEHWISLGLS